MQFSLLGLWNTTVGAHLNLFTPTPIIIMFINKTYLIFIWQTMQLLYPKFVLALEKPFCLHRGQIISDMELEIKSAHCCDLFSWWNQTILCPLHFFFQKRVCSDGSTKIKRNVISSSFHYNTTFDILYVFILGDLMFGTRNCHLKVRGSNFTGNIRGFSAGEKIKNENGFWVSPRGARKTYSLNLHTSIYPLLPGVLGTKAGLFCNGVINLFCPLPFESVVRTSVTQFNIFLIFFFYPAFGNISIITNVQVTNSLFSELWCFSCVFTNLLPKHYRKE